MKRFSLSCLAILTGVAALACAAPVGPVHAQDLTGREAPGAVSNGATDRDTYTVGVPFHTSAGIQLGVPTTKAKPRVGSLDYWTNVDKTGAGFTFTFNESAINQPDAKAAAEVSWPILQNGKDAKYTVTARLGFSQLETEESCKVRDASGQETGPFHCYLVQRGWNYDWDMHITDDRVNRWVEASGSIKGQGSVSLADGELRTKSKSGMFPQGASTVPAGSSTAFDVTNIEGSDRLADIEFSYALLDNGQPVYDRYGYPLKVTGSVMHKRGAWFWGKSFCVVRGKPVVDYDGSRNPWTGYTCDMVEDYAHTGIRDGHVHRFTDFTVRKLKD